MKFMPKKKYLAKRENLAIFHVIASCTAVAREGVVRRVVYI